MTPPRTKAAPARPSAPHSSRRDRADVRRESARWTGSAPAPAPAPARNVRLRRSSRRSLNGRRLCLGIRLLAVFVVPEALLLQRVRKVPRHVVLVVLGQHGVGPEHAGGVERALGDDALTFAKQIGENSLVGNRQRGAVVADLEAD